MNNIPKQYLDLIWEKENPYIGLKEKKTVKEWLKIQRNFQAYYKSIRRHKGKLR